MGANPALAKGVKFATDSQSTRDLALGLKCASTNVDIIHRLRSIAAHGVHELGWNICWVKAHVGFTWNEMADRFAIHGATRSGCFISKPAWLQSKVVPAPPPIVDSGHLWPISDAIAWLDHRIGPKRTHVPATATPKRGQWALCAYSANVNTLLRKGRQAWLQEQFRVNGATLVAYQETRLTGAGYLTLDGWHVWRSSAVDGQGGCQITIDPKSQIRFEDVAVCHDSSQLLALGVATNAFDGLIVSGHAPIESSQRGVNYAWWNSLRDIVRKFVSRADILLCLDTNARVGNGSRVGLGPFICEDVNDNGERLMELLLEFEMVIVNSFGDSTPTWIGSTEGHWFDFVIVPERWLSSTRIMQVTGTSSIDLSTCELEDHRPVFAFFSPLNTAHASQDRWFSRRKPGYDKLKLGDPNIVAQHHDFLSCVQHCDPDGDVDVQYSLAHSLFSKAGAFFFGKSEATPKKPWTSSDSWSTMGVTADSRKQLRRFSVVAKYNTTRYVFLLWRLSLGHRSIEPVCDAAWKLVCAARGLHAKALSHLYEALRRQRKALSADQRTWLDQEITACCEEAEHGHSGRLYGLTRRIKASKPRKLLAIEGQDGQLATGSGTVAHEWLRHWCKLSSGHISTFSAETPRHSTASSNARCTPPGVDEIVRDLGRIHCVATPEDGLPPVFMKVCRQALAPHLASLYASFIGQVQVPRQLKGGLMVPIWKGSGSRVQCGTHRAVLLESMMGKPLAKWLRRQAYPFFDSFSGETQLGGTRGILPQYAHHLASASLFWGAQTKSSMALVFQDLSSAFGSVIRELSFGADESILNCCAALGVSSDEMAFITQALASGGTAFSEAQIPPALTDFFCEYHAGTWRVVDGDPNVTFYNRGSRAGNCVADLLFGISLSKCLHASRSAMRDQGLLSMLPAHPTHGSCELAGVQYVDDMLGIVVAQDGSNLVARLWAFMDVLCSLAPLHGFKHNFGPGKTECMLSFRGSKARDLRKETGGSVLLRTGATLRFVKTYKHIGRMISVSGADGPEVQRRHQAFLRVYVPLAGKVFGCHGISIKLRTMLLHSLVMSVLLLGADTLLNLSQCNRDVLNADYMRALRKIHSAWRGPLCVEYDVALCHRLKAPTIDALLWHARLRYMASFQRTAPRTLRVLVDNLTGAGSWTHVWATDLHRAWQASPKLASLSDPQLGIAEWHSLMVWSTTLVRGRSSSVP